MQISITPPTNNSGITSDIGIVFSNTNRIDVYPVFTQNQIQGPLLLSSSGALNYGNVLLGQTSIARILTVTNSGTSAVSVANPSITGTGSSAFTIASNSCSGVSLQPQQSCVVAAVFQPTATGRLAIPMVITGGGYSNTIYLVGTGVVVPSVSISPSSANLGTVPAGTTATQVFQVTNTSTASVTLTNIVATLASATFSTEYSESDTCQAAALTAGATCSVTVSLTPQPLIGSRNGLLSLSLNNGSVTQTAALTASVGPAPATFTLAANPTSSVYAQQVVLTATLSQYSSQGSTNNGEAITFSDGGTTLGTATLSSGVGILNVTSLPAGTNTLTAAYAGDTTFAPAVSNSLTFTVSQAATITSLSETQTASTGGTTAVFTVSVGNSSGTAIPTGNVSLTDGGVTFSTLPVGASGVTIFTITTLAPGSHTIAAVYPGAVGGFTSSTSAPQIVTIPVPPDFTLSLSATTTTVTHGNPATTTFSITPSGGFTAPTAVTCIGAPANSTCTASPNPVTPVGLNPAITTVTLQTSITTASPETRAPRFSLAVLPLGLLTAFTLFLVPRKRRPVILMLIVSAASLFAAIGCGGKGAASNQPITLTTAPGTYTPTITATSGTDIHSVPWTVIVQ